MFGLSKTPKVQRAAETYQNRNQYLDLMILITYNVTELCRPGDFVCGPYRNVVYDEVSFVISLLNSVEVGDQWNRKYTKRVMQVLCNICGLNKGVCQ